MLNSKASMRKLILPVLFLHFVMGVNAATYYFSTSLGNDTRTSAQAQSSSTPWKTISKLNAIMSTLKPGDQVLFNRGESFDGGLTVTVSGTNTQPIFFGAYGSGNKPVINGFSILANWTQVRSNVWECTFWQPAGKENIVTKNGLQQAIGRYPNADAANGGYLTIDSHVGLTQLTSSQLPSSPNWTGADIAIRKNRWVIDRSTVGYHSGTTIGFTSASDNAITDKYGFFIENSTNTLDKDGEWYYDRSRARMQMYFSDNNPNAYALRGSTVETLATLSFQSYITFDNLNFSGANSYAFNLTNCSNIKINACDIVNTGINAVQALSSTYLTISNSTFTSTNNDALYLYWNCSNTLIKNNLFKNTGVVAGMGQSNTNTYEAIYIRGDNNLMQYNEIDSTGFNGIHFEGDYSTVQNNLVNVFDFVIDDGGGIYTGQGLGDNTVYNSKSIIGNIITNGIGATAGTDNTSYIATQGIYLDDNTNHVSVLNNTVANCGQTGIFNHNATNINIANNTLYNNGKEQFLLVRVSNPVSNVTLKNNIMFSKTASQLVSRIESYYGSNNLPGIGTVDSNYYCRPIDNNYIFYDLYQVGSTYYTSYENLSTWQSKFGFDAHSKGAPATFPSFSYSNATGVNKYTNGAFTSNINGVGSFASTGDLATVWNPSKIDAGTLQATSNTYSSNNNYMLTLPLSSGGTVTAGKTYLLSLSLQGGASNAPMSIYLRQSSSPNADLTTRTQIPLSTTRQNIQLGLTANATSGAAIELDVAQPNGAVWVDNVMLQEATITPTNPDDYIIFQYNASTSSKTITLSSTYYDAKGATYSGNVTLKPYTSLVLFKQTGTTTAFIASNTATQSINVQGKLTDASAASYTSSSAADVNWQVDNQSSEASYYKVERSTDAVNFTSIGKTSTKTNSDATPVNYSFTDASPLGGKNYYRITQYDAKDVPAISKIVLVNNVSFKVNPNPAHDVIHILFDQPIKPDDHIGKNISIRNTAGVVVKSLAFPSADNVSNVNVDVSALQSGMYILSITVDGKDISKPFLKQ